MEGPVRKWTWDDELAQRKRYLRDAKKEATAMIPAPGWLRIGPIYDGSHAVVYEFMREDCTLADSVAIDLGFPAEQRERFLAEAFEKLQERHAYMFAAKDYPSSTRASASDTLRSASSEIGA
jgi:hypothetical protein